MTALSAGERARLLRQLRPEPRAVATSGPRQSHGPATFAQEQLWFLDQLAPGAANYNVPFAFTLDGPLDPAVLAECFDELARRHDSLRTRLQLTPEGLRQVVEDSPGIPFTVVELDGPQAEDEAWRRIHAAVSRPFTLTAAPLWRAELFRIRDDRHLLAWVSSHAIADGWSVGLLMRELERLYGWIRAGRPPGASEEPVPQLLDYARWQRGRLQGELLEQLHRYWDTELAGLGPLSFPYDHPRPTTPTVRGRTVAFELDEVLCHDLQRRARQLGQTPFVLAVTAYHALLSRYCDSADIAVGTPVAGRDQADFDDLFGSLVNTVALRVDCSGDPSFAELVGRAAAVVRGALAHQELPFGKLVERLRPSRDGSYSPLLNTVFSYGSTPFAGREHRLGEAELHFTGVSNQTVRFDLELALDRHDGGWSGRLEYSPERLDEQSAQTLCRRYLAVLRRGLVQPGTRLSELLLDEPASGTVQGGRTPPPDATVLPDLGVPPVGSTAVVRVPDPARPALALVQEIASPQDRFVLGLPVAGACARLRDRFGRPVPDGMAGTLVISGSDGEVELPGRCMRAASGVFAAVGRQLDASAEGAHQLAADSQPPAAYEAVRAAVTRAWQEALERDEVAPDEDFFAAGGHSVLGAKLVARLRDELACELSLIEFFQALTINELTELLARRASIVEQPEHSASDALPTEELLARVEAMSEEEVLALLAEQDGTQLAESDSGGR